MMRGHIPQRSKRQSTNPRTTSSAQYSRTTVIAIQHQQVDIIGGQDHAPVHQASRHLTVCSSLGGPCRANGQLPQNWQKRILRHAPISRTNKRANKSCQWLRDMMEVISMSGGSTQHLHGALRRPRYWLRLTLPTTADKTTVRIFVWIESHILTLDISRTER